MKKLTYIALTSFAALTAGAEQRVVAAERKPDSEVKQSPVTQHEKLAGDIMDAMKELADTVMRVTDIETAKAAATKIEQIGTRFDTIASQLVPLSPPNKELRAKINVRMEARDKEMQQFMGEDLRKKMQEIGPDAAAVLQRAFGVFFQKMDKAGKEFERHFKPSE